MPGRSSSIRTVVIYSVTAVCVGLVLLAVATYLALTATIIKVPDNVDNILDQPRIQVWSEQPLAKFSVLADFRAEDAYTVDFLPARLTDLQSMDESHKKALTAANGTRIWIRVQSQKAFTWSKLAGLSNYDVDGPAAGLVSRPTTLDQGDATNAFFSGVLNGDVPLSLQIKPGVSPQIRSGPFLRLAVPTIETPFQGSERDPTNVFVGKIDGKPLCVVAMDIWAMADPLDVGNSDLSVYRIAPTTTSTTPLEWEVQGHFVPDVVFRDSAWDRAASVKLFLAGILVGIGSTVALMPLGLLAPKHDASGDSNAK